MEPLKAMCARVQLTSGSESQLMSMEQNTIHLPAVDATDRAKVVDFYLQRAGHKGFDISTVRSDLERHNVNEEEIRIIVRLVDNEHQQRLLKAADQKRANDLVYTGGVITLIGASITIATYTGLINMGDSFLIVYGPFLAGLSVMVSGVAKRKKP